MGVLTRRRAVAALAAGAGWGGSGALHAQAADGPRELATGEPLPDLPMSGLNGPDRRLSACVGRPLIVNVWASWCGPCRAEAASLERLAWSEQGSHYTVIGISTDDERAAALRWLRQSNATLSHYLDRGLQLERLFGAQRIPTTACISAAGRLLAKVQGAREWDDAASLKLLSRLFDTPGRPGASLRPR